MRKKVAAILGMLFRLGLRRCASARPTSSPSTARPRDELMRGPSRQPLHMVSAWAACQRVVLAQEAVDEKSNEIVVIPLLLERLQ